ncbi:MAG: cytosine deaminase [Oscillospiraceae bacterium]|jgi:cytosine deaminase|nr:cytosine deaminase [Oscillospiraceae bacterium]
MLIKGVHIENAAEASDIRVTDGSFEEIAPGLSPRPGEEVVNCAGKLALPPFIESHVHLDTCLTAGEPVWNQSGTLFEGIHCWSLRKETLTKEDVKSRVRRAVGMQIQNGVQFVRTHVDVTDPKLTAMEAMLELREELRGAVDLQVVAFPQEGIDSFPNGRQLLEDAVRMGADAVGAIPHFEFTREYAVESLNFAVNLAEKYGKLIDVHCDEIDDEQSRGLEVLAARAYESGLKDRVTASHTTAMHSYNNAYVSKLMRLLKLSEINFVSNPLVNTHLQGRMDTYPKRRGVTRVKELLAEGINVSLGHDDIFDPWYPLGTGNMRDVVFMGLHVCQMMGYQEIMDAYKLVSVNAARTLHLGDSYGIKAGNPASLIILDADNFYNALNRKSEVLYSFKNGRLLARSIPASREVFF